MTPPLDICTGCGMRPTCAKAEAAVLVVAKDYRGKVTALCAACGAGEEADTAPVAQETKR
jgi:hypothetical protein